MAPVDLNQEPEDEEEESPPRESVAEMLARDREQRKAAMKRKREEDEAKEKKAAKKAPAAAAAPKKDAAAAGLRKDVAAGGLRKDAAAAKKSSHDLPPLADDFSLEYAKARTGALSLPEGWLDCPPVGEPLGQLIPSKTPLGDAFRDGIEPGKRHSPAILVRNQRQKGREIGLVMDLTNTSRYYKEKELRDLGVRYIKLACRGRDEVPDNATVNEFCFEVKRFFEFPGNQHKFVMVHCTHGHNRTGYMIVNYLIRSEALKTGRSPRVYDKIQQFAQLRPPGIYKEEYIQALFNNYHERRPASLQCPPTPEWKRGLDLNGDDDLPEDEEEGRPAAPPDPTLGVVPAAEKMTNDDILGDAIPDEQQLELQQMVCAMVGVQAQQRGRRVHFPGSQPVSLDRNNLKLLRTRYYYATWKADGMRYMMMVMADGVYLIDRNFRFRRVQMRFPLKNAPLHPDKHAPVHHCTLMDGEMVIDSFDDPTDPTKKVQKRRYLVYDLMALHGHPFSMCQFSERWGRIKRDVVDPRQKEMEATKLYTYEDEPFKIRRKDFWPLNTTAKLLHNMIPKLCHEADGLILQAWDDPYVPRTHEGLLKWKYAHMNSVDFQLDTSAQGKHVLLLVDRGKPRLLEGAKVQFPEGVDPEEVQKKVIECSYLGDNLWEFMRVRHDKEHPNAWHTYTKVLNSITDNITEEVLLQEIDKIAKLPMYEARQPAPEQHHRPTPTSGHQPQHQRPPPPKAGP